MSVPVDQFSETLLLVRLEADIVPPPPADGGSVSKTVTTKSAEYTDSEASNIKKVSPLAVTVYL